MKKRNSFLAVLPEIKKVLEESNTKAYSETFLKTVFQKNREHWNISVSMKAKHFLDFLIKEKILTEYEFRDQNGKQKLIFSSSGVDEYTLIMGLHPNGYYSHYSSMILHQLTLQMPKSYYLNVEHTKEIPYQSLTQDAIDSAFSRPQRKANNYFTFKTKKTFVINGKKTNRLGILSRDSNTESYAYTDLERTLIDIAIRPAYSGGVFEVLGAYQTAKKQVDPKKLESYLTQLNFIYPYHQVIGFYLERAGYGTKVLKLFEKETPFKFYMTYNMRSKEFSAKWNLFYPKGF
ncbi:MAG: hypothetical protein NTU98_08370 [Bacteroidetes bacterium]|nr:hypothetical protein [Bacteroidota bacterium]